LIFRRSYVPAERYMLPASSVDISPTRIVHRIGSLESLSVVRRQYASLPATQILGGLKTESCCVAERADRPAFPNRTMRLRSVLEDLQSMPFSNCAKCSHVGGLAEQMNRHDGARLARNNRFFDSRWIQQQCLWVYVHESQAEATIQGHGGAGDEGEVGN